ncbi:hypothetical protein [Nocardia alba]|uniref:Uncharacterized protein n=1 Tax=Nocardia alba TaxID=225051 RepID=A0A4R1FV32_9NOCA|nr:hypothetical protein [Nocardia alba]TCJ97704.1 hypothetical protein DFR71_3752 [Nocardia alba]
MCAFRQQPGVRAEIRGSTVGGDVTINQYRNDVHLYGASAATRPAIVTGSSRWRTLAWTVLGCCVGAVPLQAWLLATSAPGTLGYALTHVVNGPVQLGFLVLCAGALIADALLTSRFHRFHGWTRAAHIAAIIAGLVALAPFLGVVLVAAVVVAMVQVMRLLMRTGDRVTESLTRFSG